MESFGALQRLLAAEIATQEEQLETLENILVLAGERSSSIPDPHHTVEGDAATKLLTSLLAEESKHDRLVPLVASEVQHVEARLGRSADSAPSHMGTLVNELAEFSSLQGDALRSLRNLQHGDARGLYIQAAMASKLFEVLSTKLELLKELQTGMAEHYSNEALRRVPQVINRPADGSMAQAARDFVIGRSNSERAAKESLGKRLARQVVGDGVAAIAGAMQPDQTAEGRNDNSGPAARLMQFMTQREGSTASSAASWKNEFHEAVMRTMMHSASPEEAISGAVAKMNPRRNNVTEVSRSRSREPSIPQRQRSTSSSTESVESGNAGQPQRSGRRSTTVSVSPAPAPIHVPDRQQALSRSRVAELEHEVDELQNATSDLLAEANRIISDCDDAVLLLSDENDALRREVESLKHAAMTKGDKRDAIDADATAALGEVHRSLEKARSQMEHERTLLNNEQTAHAAVRVELDTLQRQYRMLSSQLSLKEEEVRRATEAESSTRRSLDELSEQHERLVQQHEHEMDEQQRVIQGLRQRVSTLDAEATRSFNALEEANKNVEMSGKKLQRKQDEVKDVKMLFTQLESSHREAKQELHSLRTVMNEKEAALGRYSNLSRLKETYSPNNSHNKVQPTDASPTKSRRKGGSTGRLIRLTFDSPARAATPLPPESNVEHPMIRKPPVVSGNSHVLKVLSDAASLLEAIHKGRSDDHLKSTSGDHASCPPSLQAMNGSEDGVVPAVQLVVRSPAAPSQQRLLHDLEEKERQLMTEAASLAEQERSVLEKRSVVSSTLLAQRNQMLMKNAPDDEVEKLNNQISAVMERINQATVQIQLNKRSVEAKMDLLQRQRRVLLSGGTL